MGAQAYQRASRDKGIETLMKELEERTWFRSMTTMGCLTRPPDLSLGTHMVWGVVGMGWGFPSRHMQDQSLAYLGGGQGAFPPLA